MRFPFRTREAGGVLRAVPLAGMRSPVGAGEELKSGEFEVGRVRLGSGS